MTVAAHSRASLQHHHRQCCLVATRGQRGRVWSLEGKPGKPGTGHTAQDNITEGNDIAEASDGYQLDAWHPGAGRWWHAAEGHQPPWPDWPYGVPAQRQTAPKSVAWPTTNFASPLVDSRRCWPLIYTMPMASMGLLGTKAQRMPRLGMSWRQKREGNNIAEASGGYQLDAWHPGAGRWWHAAEGHQPPWPDWPYGVPAQRQTAPMSVAWPTTNFASPLVDSRRCWPLIYTMPMTSKGILGTKTQRMPRLGRGGGRRGRKGVWDTLMQAWTLTIPGLTVKYVGGAHHHGPCCRQGNTGLCLQTMCNLWCGPPSGRPWPLRRVMHCNIPCDTPSSGGRPSCPALGTNCSATWSTAVQRGQWHDQVSVLLHWHVLTVWLGMPSGQPAQDWASQCNCSHPGWYEVAITGSTDCKGN